MPAAPLAPCMVVGIDRGGESQQAASVKFRRILLRRKARRKAIFIEHNSRRKARSKGGRKASRKLKIVKIKADREEQGEKAPVPGEKVLGLGENVFGFE